MARPADEPIASSQPGPKRSLIPWVRFRQWREERFQRTREELTAYLQAATPIAIKAHEEYLAWRVAVAEPIQDTQKAANASATFWWRVTEALGRFEALVPPPVARQYHRTFGEAMRHASNGADAAKNGFRANKIYEVSRGLGFLDDFVKSMDAAEAEIGRLLRKYQLV